jgi:hypothetical protein
MARREPCRDRRTEDLESIDTEKSMNDMQRKGSLTAVLAIVAAVSLAPVTAAEYWTVPRPDTEELLDEAAVQGYRLLDLRTAMVEAESRFYARYNELNSRDEFDIECEEYRGIDTNFIERHCHTRAWKEAAHQESIAVYDAIDRQSNDGDSGARPRFLPANLALQALFPEYKDNLLQLLSRHPDLRRLADERQQLGKRYDTERRKRTKGKLVRIE